MRESEKVEEGKKRREGKQRIREKETERKGRASNLGGTLHIIAKVSPSPKEKASHPNSRHQIRGKIEARGSNRRSVLRWSLHRTEEAQLGRVLHGLARIRHAILCTFILI